MLLPFFIFGVSFIFYSGWVFWAKMTNPAYLDATEVLSTTVTLTEQGFDPQNIKVRQGARIEFKTTHEHPFWPASNTHPWHSIYPAFDPKKPLEPNESWYFIFDQIGIWGYHDHLRSYFTGNIEVVD